MRRLRRQVDDIGGVVEVDRGVACGREHSNALLVGVRRRLPQGYRQLCRPHALAREDRAETHVDDVRAGATLGDRRRGVDDPADHRLEGSATTIQRLHADDRGPGRDADRADPVVPRRDDTRHVCGMRERGARATGRRCTRDILVECEILDERCRVRHVNAAVEVDVEVVQPAIDDGNAHPCAACPGVPRLGCVHRLDRPLDIEKGLVAAEARAPDDAARVRIERYRGFLRIDPLHDHVRGHGAHTSELRDAGRKARVARDCERDADLGERARQGATGGPDRVGEAGGHRVPGALDHIGARAARRGDG